MQSISIIGAGQLGKALARLFHQKKLLQIKSILNRNKTLKKSNNKILCKSV